MYIVCRAMLIHSSLPKPTGCGDLHQQFLQLGRLAPSLPPPLLHGLDGHRLMGTKLQGRNAQSVGTRLQRETGSLSWEKLHLERNRGLVRSWLPRIVNKNMDLTHDTQSYVLFIFNGDLSRETTKSMSHASTLFS